MFKKVRILYVKNSSERHKISEKSFFISKRLFTFL